MMRIPDVLGLRQRMFLRRFNQSVSSFDWMSNKAN